MQRTFNITTATQRWAAIFSLRSNMALYKWKKYQKPNEKLEIILKAYNKWASTIDWNVFMWFILVCLERNKIGNYIVCHLNWFLSVFRLDSLCAVDNGIVEANRQKECRVSNEQPSNDIKTKSQSPAMKKNEEKIFDYRTVTSNGNCLKWDKMSQFRCFCSLILSQQNL